MTFHNADGEVTIAGQLTMIDMALANLDASTC
jgi:hypothetical protein